MRKILLFAAALALVASPAGAWEVGEAINYQNQTQNVHAFGGPGYLHSTYTSDQFGAGGSNWNGAEGQGQVEGIQGSYSYAGSTHSWDLQNATGGGSNMGIHWEGGYTDAQAVGGVNGYGSAGYAGSQLDTNRWAFSVGNAGAYSYTKGYVAYKTVNNWYGTSQEFDGFSYVNAGAQGHYGNVYTNTVGGSAAMNSGWQSTSMSAVSASRSEINSYGNAGGMTGNYNHYQQATGNGLTYQYQTGWTATEVSE